MMTLIRLCLRPVSYTHLDVYKRQLVTLLIRDTAGTGSLLGFAGCADEAFPILFFLRGDFDPLAEGAVVDLRGGLIVIDLHKRVLRFSISRNGGLWVLPKNEYRKPTAVLTEFSVSDCSKPAQKAATVLNYLHLPVEPSGIS